MKIKQNFLLSKNFTFIAKTVYLDYFLQPVYHMLASEEFHLVFLHDPDQLLVKGGPY